MPVLLSPRAAALTVGGPVPEAGGRCGAAGALGYVLVDLEVIERRVVVEPLDGAKIRRGFHSCRVSQDSPMRSIAPGAKFSTETSASRISFSITSRPSGDFVLIASERLLLFSMVKYSASTSGMSRN